MKTTVDEVLLLKVRQRHPGLDDAALFDEALAALPEVQRAGQIDATYPAYDERPLDETDEWGDLASFCAAVSSS